MVILEDLKEINDVIKDLAEFVQNDSVVKPDFEEYIKTAKDLRFPNRRKNNGDENHS